MGNPPFTQRPNLKIFGFGPPVILPPAARRGMMKTIMTTRILWIEGRRGGGPAFIPGLRQKGYQVEEVATGRAALARLPALDPAMAVVNAASLGTSGGRICQRLRQRLNGHPVLLIRSQDQGRPHETAAHQVLVLPFTIRKLLNRVRALVPSESERVLTVGPLRLCPDHHQVQVDGGRPRHLTPRLTDLLLAFMQQPGEVLPREALFRQVWRTEYVGDTRTLDVHISWLRKKIEADPRRPRLLTTVRGVGYRLDPEPGERHRS